MKIRISERESICGENMANLFELFEQISKKEERTSGPVEFLVVGLGNPGNQYQNTRHNAGFLAVDDLAKRYGFSVNTAKFKALVGEAVIAGRRVLVMKPQTFMNSSGEAVGEAVRFYKLKPEQVIVFSDDISLDVGRLRVRRKGSDGGHNGLKSICTHLHADTYPRIRIGVGQKPAAFDDLADWVLSAFGKEELEKLNQANATLAEGLELLLNGRVEEAMQRCNGK